MRLSLGTKWYDRLWAALMFFTRLPLWRIHQPQRESFRAVVEFWPLTGWLTAGMMAAVVYFGGMAFPHMVAVALAIAARMLLTGALHEDGLADFLDGFGGGGGDKARILRIMKDSRIGTYGVLGLAVYLALLFLCLSSMPPGMAALAIMAADPYSKMLAAQVTTMLPYARREEESKARVTYRKMGIRAGVLLFFQGTLPLALFICTYKGALRWDLVVFVPGVVMYFLYLYVLRKLRGYTGDCCGALCLLIELSFYLCVVAQMASVPAW